MHQTDFLLVTNEQKDKEYQPRSLTIIVTQEDCTNARLLTTSIVLEEKHTIYHVLICNECRIETIKGHWSSKGRGHKGPRPPLEKNPGYTIVMGYSFYTKTFTFTVTIIIIKRRKKKSSNLLDDMQLSTFTVSLSNMLFYCISEFGISQ